MEFTLNTQIFNFFVSFIFGILFSIIFDIVKIFNIIFAKISINTRDFSYFLIYGVSSFLLSLAINNGDFSFYIVFSEFLGWLLWHQIFGNKIVKRLEKTVKKIKRYLLQFLEIKIKRNLNSFKNKIKVFCKNRLFKKTRKKKKKNQKSESNNSNKKLKINRLTGREA